MFDTAQILRAGADYTKYTHPGPTVTAVSASANLTNAAGNTGFVQLEHVDRIPHPGMALIFTFPGPITATGAGTTGTTLAFTNTFSDDGTNAVAGLSLVTGSLGLTFDTGELTAAYAARSTSTISEPGLSEGFILYYRLPEIRHAYIKTAWATSLGASITAVDYGKVGIYIDQVPDTVPNNWYELA